MIGCMKWRLFSEGKSMDSGWNPGGDAPSDVLGAGLDHKHVPVPRFLPELRTAIWQGCGARGLKRHKIVISAREAEHGQRTAPVSTAAAFRRASEEHLEIGKADSGPIYRTPRVADP
jgi:hypothetical protein